MVCLQLKILDQNNNILAENSGIGGVSLVHGKEYAEGDKIVLSASMYDLHVVWQVDDALGSALCYISEEVAYAIPFGEKKRVYSPKAFSGNKHYLYARVAESHEIAQYRNLAMNVADQHDVIVCFPHASANVETRGESVFAAKNAIDGVHENHGHGMWPYASWGINRDPNAEMKIDFGRKVLIDCLKITLRADFPHDSYWTKGTVLFSDGSKEVLSFKKTDGIQVFPIKPRIIESLSFGELIKADDASPFPALTQIEVFGHDLNGNTIKL